ncbi:MAG: hydroxymethylpyrimidine/phosphomethylpyrimidine kinase [Gammaproteobacteria bacterium]|nr:hydroxymethylpyrimidine/phosphomethylpyrimidine kinase [Gammaproteobacteria bacterium]
MDLPTCLVFSGHDPSGGAGVQADIEAVASMGSHAVTVITALTVQDTANVHAVESVSAPLFIQQTRTLLADIKPAAVKIGLIPDVAIVEAIHSILVDMGGVPIVLDPVVWSGGGTLLQDDAVAEAVKSLLFPLATVITPNEREAKRYAANADTLEACGISLLESGCDYVLITGGDSGTDKVTNKLYANNRCLDIFSWPRLPHEFHGSGCTLASSIAGLLSHGHEPHTAIREAQKYTWDSLNHAYRTGRGQKQPHRFFWAARSS